MTKLLSANLARLRRDTIFWVVTAAVLLSSLAAAFNASYSAAAMIASGYSIIADDYFFNTAPMMGMFCAVFISLFLGTEYGDGAVRNKLTVGHRRDSIYLAGFLAVFFGNLVFLAAWLLGSVPTLLLIGPLEMGLRGFLVYVLIAVGFTAVLSAVFTAVGHLSSNKAITVVLTLLVWLVLLFAASALDGRLHEPEMQSSIMMTANGIEMLDPEPNPLYLSGAARQVAEFLRDLLPTGQAILMSDAAIEHPLRQILCSISLTGLVTAGGVLCFRRKDLK